MKKVFSVVLSMILIASIAAPALAKDSQDEALKKVTLTVKTVLGIDNSYTEFSGNRSDEGDFSYWSLYWGKDGESISVNADANGKVFSYRRNIDNPGYSYNAHYAPTFPKASRTAVLPVAKAFAEKLLSKYETLSFSEADEPVGIHTADTYYLNGLIKYNGLKSPETFSVEVSLGDMRVIGFSRSYNLSVYTGDIPSATPVVTADRASELLNGQVQLQLQYVLDQEGKTAILQYLPVHKDSVAVDANTGAIIDLYQIVYYPAPMADEAFRSNARGETGLSEVEQSTVDTLVGVKSKNELDLAVRAITALGVDSIYTLDSASYMMDKASGTVQCTLNYIKKISDEGMLQSRFPEDYRRMKTSGGIYPINIDKSVTLDAKTLSLISLYTYKNAEKEAAAQTRDALKTKAESFLRAHFAEKYKASSLYTLGSNAEEGRFSYVQTANSIPFPTNVLYVSVNSYDGTIDSFSTNWTEGVTFASADGLIRTEKAAVGYQSCFETVLQYVETAADAAVNTSQIAYPGNRNASKLVLAYRYEAENAVIGIDAKTGEAIIAASDSPQPIVYTDLSGRPGKAKIEKLAEYGIGFKSTSFQPTSKLTQKDALILLLSAVGYTTDDEGGLYQVAYSYRFLTKAEKDAGKSLTRAEFVKMLISATEYGSAAKLSGIYYCGFRDDSKISKAHYGYIAIAKALKVVSGDAKNNFNPSTAITREDAAVMLYHFMERSL